MHTFPAFFPEKLASLLPPCVRFTPTHSPRFRNEVLPDLENKKVDVFWSDHRLAALWANSDAAKAEFPDYSYQVLARVCVCAC